MIIPDKKKTVSVILSRMGADGKDGPSMEAKNESEMDAGDDSLKAISEDIMMAIKEGSAHDLMISLKAFMAGCDSDDQGE